MHRQRVPVGDVILVGVLQRQSQHYCQLGSSTAERWTLYVLTCWPPAAGPSAPAESVIMLNGNGRVVQARVIEDQAKQEGPHPHVCELL